MVWYESLWVVPMTRAPRAYGLHLLRRHDYSMAHSIIFRYPILHEYIIIDIYIYIYIYIGRRHWFAFTTVRPVWLNNYGLATDNDQPKYGAARKP